MNWTPEQLAVLEAWGQGVAVQAGAGAGKTTVLVEKCARLLSLKPEARICAVSFTERSAADLRLKLSRFDLSRHWVTTIHGLCGLVIREFPAAAKLQGDERVLSESQALSLWREAVEFLWFDPRGDESPETAALQRLLAREARSGLEALLVRLRDLETAGIFELATQASFAGDLGDLLLTAKRVLVRYEELKTLSGGLDFSDLEKRAHLALLDPAVRRELQARFDLVLIDEFQDTNAVQAEILWAVARPDRSNLCVVGDPKQSIYRFRDADVTLFSELCATLPKTLALTTNFRSDPEILKFVNRVCEPVFASSEMEYLPLVPGKTESRGSESVAKLEVSGPDELAAYLLEKNRQGVEWEKMAILMRRIRGNERWIQALSRRGIPVAVGGGGLFWSDPRVLECVALISWWAAPADELSALTFLRAPWVRVEDSEIDRWMALERDLLQFWKSDHPVARCLAPLREGTSVRPAEILQRLLSTSGEVAELTAPLRQSILALVHRFEELSITGYSFFEASMRVRELCQQGRREKEVPPPRNRGVLPILTIHASKGLEFDHVVLVDFGKKPRAGRLPLLFWDRKKGAFLTDRDENGDKVEEDPAFMDWKSWEQRAQLAESKRQFYVALTRAKRELVLVCEPVSDLEADSKKAAQMEHWRAWVEHFGSGVLKLSGVEPSPGADIQKSDSRKAVQVASVSAKPELVRARHAVTEWTLLSRCERAYVRTVLRTESESDLPESQSGELWGGVPSRQADRGRRVQKLSAVALGKKVHALLEKWARFSADRAFLREQIQALESEAGSKRFSAKRVLDWLEQTPWLSDPGISEWPFEWQVGGVSLVGTIDRLVERETINGKELVVIDYKVFSKLKDAEAVRELYSAQLELYAGALAAYVREKGLDRRLRAVLIQIAPEGVQELEVNLDADGLQRTPQALALRARQLIADPSLGEMNPRRQESCRYCPHDDNCQ